MSVETIDRKTVLQKTASGRAEIRQRQAGLSALQRQLLIIIDGQKDVGAIAAMFPRADVVEALWCLVEERLIEVAPPGVSANVSAPLSVPVTAAPAVDSAFGAFRKSIETPLPVGVPVEAAPRVVAAPAEPVDAGAGHGAALAGARQFMVDAARANIGLLAERLIARIESARSLAELAAVASQWHMALRDSKRGKPLADELLEQALALLGAPALPPSS